MRHESLLSADEKRQWLELEVTLGTNETLIETELHKLKTFFRTFDETEREFIRNKTGIDLSNHNHLLLKRNHALLKLLLVKKFIDQHGLSIIREAKNDPSLVEKDIYFKVVEDLFDENKYPEDIFVYSTYRRRGSPNTWFRVINNETSDSIESQIIDKAESLKNYLNRNLKIARKIRFNLRIGGLRLILFSKPIAAKVIRGENKNVEVQRMTHTILIFDKANKKIGIVTGSKKEIQLMQRYVRYILFKDSIATPRLDCEQNKNEVLKKLLASNPTHGTLLNCVVFKSTLMESQPSMRLKVNGNTSLDAALSSIENVWKDLGIDALKSVDYQHQGKIGTAYLYGDEWKRLFINVTAKRHSIEFEEAILADLNERLEINVKESRLIVELLTDEFILEKILKDKKIPTFPPVPEQVEKLLIKLIRQKFIKKPSKIAKRKCQNCYSTSWDSWTCPNCDRESMTVVGEAINIKTQELSIIRQLCNNLETNLPSYKATLIPYKQRRSYKKTVLRLHNPIKNLSTFSFIISNKKDLEFAEDLLKEGFGIIAIVDPDISGKIDHIRSLGCDIVPLHIALGKLVNEQAHLTFLPLVENQEQKVLERIFENLRSSVNRLKDKPEDYNEDMFEIDITNVFQGIVPDVIRLGTEYKGKNVPDGYCCYGYRNSNRRKRKRLFGWDAKYTYGVSYNLSSRDLKIQKGYINWLIDKSKEPYRMGNLGIYAFITNSVENTGLDKVLSNLCEFNNFPRQGRLIVLKDQLVVKIGEWLLNNWQRVLNNNSLAAEEFFRYIRTKRKSKPYNIFGTDKWETLEKKLSQGL
ncbi:MAG: hypothetical protein AB7J46_04910 [Candidatus Altimarinota bacterium]